MLGPTSLKAFEELDSNFKDTSIRTFISFQMNPLPGLKPRVSGLLT
jgi:hypothetical protein